MDKDGNFQGLPDSWMEKLNDMVIEDTKNGITNASEIQKDVVKFFKVNQAFQLNIALIHLLQNIQNRTHIEMKRKCTQILFIILEKTLVKKLKRMILMNWTT